MNFSIITKSENFEIEQMFHVELDGNIKILSTPRLLGKGEVYELECLEKIRQAVSKKMTELDNLKIKL